MKFLYADALDYVDPQYDFDNDRRARHGRAHANDEFPHEFFRQAPYDGLLVSRAIVGDHLRKGKYSESQSMRFQREGARKFLRFPEEKFPNSIVMGDCGAFSYKNEKQPPYTVDDTLEFYANGQFTHGCSVDHVIFDFQDDKSPPSDDARRRYEITQTLAREFIATSKHLGRGFTPVGIIQGWSPRSMARAGASLARMGYRYMAVGGMVPLRMEQINEALEAIREKLPRGVRLHLLGFGKIESLDQLRRHGVASFDTTSPLTRAFKDGRKNYWIPKEGGGFEYYTAVRIPQALGNDKVIRSARGGRVDQERLVALERRALQTVRGFAKRRVKLSTAVDNVITYQRYALWNHRMSETENNEHFDSLRPIYVRTLGDRPWEDCSCRVCKEIGVDALIFRSSNHNKRRGMHNLQVFHGHMVSLRGSTNGCDHV